MATESEISKRQQEINDWVYNHEPLLYQKTYQAIQSGNAKIEQLEGGRLVVKDASNNIIEGVGVDPNTGQIRVPTSNGALWVSTEIGQGGKLTPIAPENYNNQVSYQSKGNDWDKYGGLVMTAAGLLGAPYLSGLIGGATGLTGAALTGATGATIGGIGSALTGGDPLKGALLGGLGGYVGGSLMGSGTSPDLGMNSNLTMAQIESGLGTPGYGYGAQAASSGLFNPASIGAGAYMDFNGVPTAYAPDNIDVGGGYNPATGMSGDIPQADYSNEGRNYPTAQSTQGSGGSPINASMASTAAGAGLTASQIAQLTKAGLGLLGAGVAGSALSGGMGGAGSIPTQRAPEYSPEYYQDIQRYYDAYMPAVPRDVVSPLQSWYGTGYSGSALTPAITPSAVAPVSTPSVFPVAASAPVPTVTAPVASDQGLFTTGQGSAPYTPPKPVDPVAEQKAMEEARKRSQEQLAMRAALRAANAGQPNYFTLSQGDPNAGIFGVTGVYPENTFVSKPKFNKDQMLNDWNAYWDTAKAGSSMDWVGGTLTRNANGTATYNAGGKELTFNKNTPLGWIAEQSPDIGAAWAKNYNFTADKTAASQPYGAESTIPWANYLMSNYGPTFNLAQASEAMNKTGGQMGYYQELGQGLYGLNPTVYGKYGL